MKDKKQFGTEVPTFKYKVRVKKAHGDKFGVLAVSADNAKNAPLIFSAGGMDDPCIKIWNFESKELISTIDAKDMYANIFMNLIVSRQNPGGNLISSLDTSQKEPKGAWKSRVEELPSYKRLRDEKKRKKTSGPEDTGQHFILLCLTTSCIRVLKVVIRQKNKAEVRENTVAIDSKSRMANSIMQISKSTEESFTVFASDGVGKVQIFAMKLNVS